MPVTSELIAAAELEVGAEFHRELEGYFALIRDLTDVSGRLLQSIDDVEGDPRAIHAVAIILARELSELQAAAHLVRLGYPAQALTLTGTMQELMHTAAYIGASEVRAEQWFSHADRTNAYPGQLKKTFRAVGEAMGAMPEIVAREYGRIYRDICMVKHGNPMAMGNTSVVVTEDAAHILASPHLSEPMFRFAHSTLQYAVRYALLTAMVFAKHHLDETAAQDALTELRRLSDSQKRLVEQTAQRFSAKAE